MRSALLVVLTLVLVAGCVRLTPQVRRSDGVREPRRVVLLPATCRSVDGGCEPAYALGPTGIVKNELTFAGFSVIDADRLVADARSRDESSAFVRLFDVTTIEGGSLRQSGSLFEDLSPEQRRALLDEAGADGIVLIRAQVGVRQGLSPVRLNEVVIRLGRGHDDELVWVTRCSAKSGLSPPIHQALEKATRCALSGVLETTRDTDLYQSAL